MSARRLWTVAVALALLAGCARRPAKPWADTWGSLANTGPRWRVGDALVVAEHEGRPEGVRIRRTTWTLVSRDSVRGTFRVSTDGAAPREVTLPFHPDGPVVAVYGGSVVRGRRAAGGALERLTVPAGRFRCGRTWRDVEESDGRVMRVDEWWAPGIPVPVQRWKRWEGAIDQLRAPPRGDPGVRVGTTWSVLDAVIHVR